MYIGIYLPVPELELEGRNISTGSGLNQWKALEDKKKGFSISSPTCSSSAVADGRVDKNKYYFYIVPTKYIYKQLSRIFSQFSEH